MYEANDLTNEQLANVVDVVNTYGVEIPSLTDEQILTTEYVQWKRLQAIQNDDKRAELEADIAFFELALELARERLAELDTENEG